MDHSRLRVGVFAILAAIVLTWLAAASDRLNHAFSFTGQKADYYNLLVDGFLEGHLYMKAEVDPRRHSPDSEVRKRSTFLLDAGEYQGRYYLYYGVVPAAIVLLPYSALTGHDLSLNVATLGFVLLGFLLSLIWYCVIRRNYSPATSAIVDCAIVLMLAFGPATTFLLRRSMFYELPLAAGYAFQCGFILSVTKALGDPARGGRWIALASLCVGLAAGCHPNYALLTPLVALTAWWIHRGPPRVPAGRLAVMAVLPAAIIGAALAWYNYARFGHPLEFGFKYGVNAFFETKDKLLSPAFLWPNFKWYYLTPPTLQPYFPFVFPADASFRPSGYHGAEAIHGQFMVSLLLAWIGAGALAYFRAMTWPHQVRRLTCVCGCAFLAAALFILPFGIRANRYMVDFQLPLIVLGVLTATRLGRLQQRRRLQQLWQAGLLGLTLLMSIGNLLAAIQQFDQFRHTRPGSFNALTHILNPPWSFWSRLGLVKTGTLAFDVSFPARTQPAYEPLLTIGAPGYSDSVYAVQYPGNRVEFTIDHFGYGGPRSRIFTYEPGRTYSMRINLGGFYPPQTDPCFAGTPLPLIELIKSTAQVDFDGQRVIDENIPLYEAAPWHRDLGSNLTTHTAFSSRFSGQMTNARWLPPPALSELTVILARSSVLRLKVIFPSGMPAGNQPLIGFGRMGHGSLLFLQPTGPEQWNLSLDEWGYASAPASSVRIKPGEHIFDLFIGPRAATDPLVAQTGLDALLRPSQHRLMVWLDDRLIGDFQLTHHLNNFGQATPGANPQGFSTSEASFYVRLDHVLLNETARGHILHQVAQRP